MANKTKIESFDIYTEEVREVLGRPPRALYIYGNAIIFVILIVFAVLSWLIQYPDTINAQVIITSEVGPIILKSKSSGYISALDYNEGDTISIGDPLIIIKENIDYPDLISLENIIKDISNNKGNPYKIPPLRNLELGNLSLDYAQLTSSLEQYNNFINSNPYYREAGKILDEIQSLQKMSVILSDSKREIIDQLSIEEQNIRRQEKLRKQEVISEQNLENTKLEHLRSKSEVNNYNYRIEEIGSRIENLQRQYEGLNKTENRNINQIKTQIYEQVNIISAKIKIWKNDHLLIAPFDGIISYSSFIQENQLVDIDQPLVVVSPITSDYEIRGEIPFSKSGLVKQGQKMIINLPAYPSNENGILRGKIERVNLVPSENGYLFFGSLDDGMVTSYNKTITYRPMMNGNADIILEDLRLIERIFYEIKNIFINQ